MTMKQTTRALRNRLVLGGVALIVALQALLAAMPLTANAAATAQLYLSPSSQSVTNGSNLTFSVVVNTNGTSVNSVQSVLTYSAANFSYVSISPGAAFGIFPSPSVSSGSIQFSAATTGSVTGTQTVATITLKAVGNGSSPMSLAAVCAPGDYSLSCSAAYNSSTSENDLASVSGGTYTVNAPTSTPSGGGGGGGSSPAASSGSSSGSAGTAGASTSTAPAATAAPQPGATAAGAPKISNLKVSKVTDTSAEITWQTDMPATSQVHYGLSDKYGLVANGSGLTTDHKVVLAAPHLQKGQTYHFIASSANAAGASASSANQTFSTPGFTVTLIIRDQSSKPIDKAKVTMGKLTKVTNDKGEVIFADIPAGTQGVTIKAGNKTTVASVEVGVLKPGSQEYQPQRFALTAEVGSGVPFMLGVGIALLVAVAIAVWTPLLVTLKRLFSHTEPPLGPSVGGLGGSSTPPPSAGPGTPMVGSPHPSEMFSPGSVIQPQAPPANTPLNKLNGENNGSRS